VGLWSCVSIRVAVQIFFVNEFPFLAKKEKNKNLPTGSEKSKSQCDGREERRGS
jgi:hypothetical protein